MPLYIGTLLVNRVVPLRWLMVVLVCLLGTAGFFFLLVAAAGAAFGSSSAAHRLWILTLTLWPLLVLLAVWMLWHMREGPVLPRFLRDEGDAPLGKKPANQNDPW